jgi:hypothetical protein
MSGTTPKSHQWSIHITRLITTPKQDVVPNIYGSTVKA